MDKTNTPKDYLRLRVNGSFGVYLDGQNNMNVLDAVLYLQNTLGCSEPEATQYVLTLPRI